jgi:multidrug resistance efflux pump
MAQAAQAKPAVAKDPVRTWTLRVALLLVGLLLLQIASDRGAPVTTQATVEGLLLPVAARVAGQVTEVAVADNSVVEAGEVLFRVDPTPYRLAVDGAEAQLEQRGQAVGASTAQIATAQARLAERRANLGNVRVQSARIIDLATQGILPGAQADQARSDLVRAEAEVAAAESEVQRAQAALGPRGADNPEVRAASANLETARFNLENTTIVAPTRAYVTNLRLANGQYAAVGQPLLTLIDLRGAWVVAWFRENQLGNVRVGDRVEIALDIRPGRILRGRVAGLGGGVMTINQQATAGTLVQLPRGGEWLTTAQRLPVRIEFDPPDRVPEGVRLGSQATVMVRTQGFSPLRPVWWAYIRMRSLFSYAY